MMDYKEILNRIKSRSNEISQRLITSERDRNILRIGAVALVCFVLLFVYQSYSGKASQYERQVNALQQELVTVKRLSKDYRESTEMLRKLSSSIQKENEALISVIEKILVDNQIDRQNFSIKDSSTRTSGDDGLYEVTSIEVDLRRVQIYKLLDVIYTVNTRDSFLKVSDLRMRARFDNPDRIDATFKLSTYEFKQVI